jgi:hypothetical protein
MTDRPIATRQKGGKNMTGEKYIDVGSDLSIDFELGLDILNDTKDQESL